ncbi:nucleotidyltransferase family protein [Bacillus canaveralius]|uniref:Nucleotidyltransferase family protein n=1 Tax=Bacillus canaveralius TaxID=1403243 RepID=A0A2N5GMA7_9BACI|nr:nucleotidyltransferase family protein [Bacillus canaveralius]PLR83000.1 nucleotidyltransferase family protein [Bacillus canaveralius]PLR96996.1 nucleotidyltransferase family protein [Bacillus canaveralius]
MDGIGAIILAAGQATRFGKLKQFQLLANKPLFIYPVELASQLKLNPILLVGNSKSSEHMLNAINELNVTYLENNESSQGMSTSLKKGLLILGNDINAVLVFLGDQPFIPASVVDKLIRTYKEQYKRGVRIVRPSYKGKKGHPVLFDRSIFPALFAIKGDRGARDIIESHSEQVETVEFSTMEWNLDIDTQNDLDIARDYLIKLTSNTSD